MQFENVAREWRCKWKDDGGGNAVCETPVPRGKMASCSPQQCQERPRAAARLGQADLIGLLTARWNPRLHVQVMTCTCHVTCHMHMHMICTSAGKASSAALVEIADLVDEYLPKLKALEGAVVNRAVCGGCLDFKIATTVPLATFFKPTVSEKKRKTAEGITPPFPSPGPARHLRPVGGGGPPARGRVPREAQEDRRRLAGGDADNDEPGPLS